MRVLFVMLHTGFFRNYAGTLRALAAGGHEVYVAWEYGDAKWGQDTAIARLLAECPGVTAGPAPERAAGIRALLARMDSTALRSGDQAGERSDAPAESEVWAAFATITRVMRDTIRYTDPRLAGRTRLRERAEKRLPGALLGAIRATSALGRPAVRGLDRLLAFAEHAVPVSPVVRSFVARHAPDLLVVTPLVEFGSQQVDYLKAGHDLGVPTMLAVASWDNLTTKGALRVVPDRVVVWNDTQRAEATELHGVARDRITVSGAQLFDEWFTRSPRRTREAFAARVGLAADRPIVLYTGSSSFIAPNEWRFAERWITAVRNAPDARVANAGILIRPHPANAKPWRALDLAGFDNVALWPPIGTSPSGADAVDDFFDSLFHSAAVVGINTSALIEAAIIDRPVCSVLDEEFAHSQRGTIHFGRLLEEEGGPLFATTSLDDHVVQLGEILATPGIASVRNRAFVGAFVRPHGLDRPVTPIVVDAMVSAARGKAVRRRSGALTSASRLALYPLALGVRALVDQRPVWIYAVRPILTMTLVGAGAAYRLQAAAARRSQSAAKRTRRSWRIMSHESRRRWHLGRDRLAKRTRKGARRAWTMARRAGSGVKRLVGLSQGAGR